ncbi:MAG: glycosyltransferase family 25 protein [Acidobacteria bacterium]|nr:glycosyltransferase family 25 protein [Acidobacteriota bacterium]
MNNQLPPIWVISLQRSTDRRARITRHLTEHKLSFEIIDAIDGRQLTSEQLAQYDARQAVRNLGRELVPAEIACALSHLSIYQRMVDQKLDEVLILEDDAVLQYGFFDVLRHRSNFPKDWELVLLCHNRAIDSVWYHHPLVEHFKVVRFARRVMSSAGYLLKQSTARKLLTAGYPVCVPSDFLTGGRVRVGIKIYGIWPSCVATLHRDDVSYSTMPEVRFYRTGTRDHLKAAGYFSILWLRIKHRLRRLYYRYNPLGVV